MTREERLEMLRDRNAVIGSPAVGWLLSEVDRLDRELFGRVSALRLVLRRIADEADASEPISVRVARCADEALAADDAAAEAARG